mmetsp:Transcript_18014/g.25164  ORF Transcript_18014/g.25164 Transcript_18014/m.25164 type:complete len:234 (-) Transcript_18014:70-771(-)
MSSLLASWSNSPLSIKLLTGISILIATVFVIKRLLKPKICTEKKDLTGKVIVITGGNTGIGYETAKSLAGMGGTVIIACRDSKKANDAINRLKSENASLKVETLPLDLSSFESIKKFVSDFSQKYNKIDIRYEMTEKDIAMFPDIELVLKPLEGGNAATLTWSPQYYFSNFSMLTALGYKNCTSDKMFGLAWMAREWSYREGVVMGAAMLSQYYNTFDVNSNPVTWSLAPIEQ